MPLISTTIPNLIGGVSQQPYTIRMASQCEAMVNCLPSVVEFLRRRPATRHVARIMNTTVADASVHVIDRDMAEQYIVVAANNSVQVFDLNGNAKPVTFTANPDYLATATPNADISYLTINDYTFLLNKTVTVANSGKSTATRTPEALVFVKQASYATDYTVTLDGTEFRHTTFKDDNRRASDGLEFTSKNGFNMDDTAALDSQRYKLSSSTIATDLAAKINADGRYHCRMAKSSLWIQRHDGAPFTCKVADSRSNTHISVTVGKIQRFSDLPTVAPNGFVTEITGDQSSSFDNYFVRFETNDGTDFDDGVWVETVKPGIPYSLDATTMPHALVREADGSFTFKTLDWSPRTCGDPDSAPDPSFVGRRLSAIFFYRNRLGLLAGENCILSEAGKFFNFYPTTVTTIVDSDVIDVAASHTKAANLYHACAFSEGLLLFSDTTQFLLEHDDTLSIKTVAVKPITEFESSVRAAPLGAGKTIFFAATRGGYAGVREYLVDEDSSLTDAPDITSHIPHYIPGEIAKLVGSTNEDCLLALPTKERRTLALYKYFWNGREKLQSSWSMWTFGGEVLSAAFLNSELILIMQYPDGVYLESMRLEPGYTDDNAPYECALDRKVREKDVLLFHNEQARHTTLTFPYRLTAPPVVVSRFAGSGETSAIPAGRTFEVVRWDDTTATVSGDLRNVLFFAGLPYASLYEFSPQIMRDEAGNGTKLAVTEGRLQLRSLTLTYGDTGYFEVDVTPEHRDTVRHTFTGRVLGHGSNTIGAPATPSGTFRVPVLARAETTTIRLCSDSFLPFQITSAGWEGYYHIRSRRI